MPSWTPQDLDAFHKFHMDIKEDVMRRAARTDPPKKITKKPDSKRK